MMHTEIVKIIEGGLSKDTKKVYSYASHLAKKLIEDGDDKFAERILRVLSNGLGGSPVYKDELFTSPVDSETRLSIADIFFPDKIVTDQLVLSEAVNKSISNFIDVINNRVSLEDAGLEIKCSLLLYGPPGCGKTTIAKHIAQRLELPIIIARFDSLISSLLGSTSKNIRRLFEYASNKPCILFLDEFDAIAKDRKDPQELGELKRVINSLLQNIDEYLNNNILIAATNHHELLDNAIWRRFDHVIEIGLPTLPEIELMINNLTKRISSEISLDKKKKQIIIESLSGLTNSEIKKIITNAISKSIINSDEQILLEDFLIEIYGYLMKNNISIEGTINFLYEKGISQHAIANILNTSIRQVRNHLKQS